MSTVAPTEPASPSTSSSRTAIGPPLAAEAIQRDEAAKTVQPTYDNCAGRRHFAIRRLHSALGLVFGGYVTVHLIVNATGLSPRMYQENVDKIHSLEPMLPFIEIAAIFGPLAVHVLYGIYIAFAGVKFNTTKYNYGGNVRYFLQRWTAVILLAFIAFHIATLHRWGFHLIYTITHVPLLSEYETMGLFNAHNQAFQSTVSGVKYFWNPDNPFHPGNILIMAFYLLGVWSAVFHWANGLWTSAIAWGVTVTRKSQQRWGHVCLAFGLLMFVVGTIAWAAFTIAPASQGDTSRWDDGPNGTHTLPDEDTTHEQDQGLVSKKTPEDISATSNATSRP